MNAQTFMTADDIRFTTKEDDHTHTLSAYMIHQWPSTRAELIKDVQPYWPSRDEVVVIDRIAMKCRRIM